MKRKTAIVFAGIMSLWLAACGQTGNVQTEPSAVETVQETQSGRETTDGKTTDGQTEAPAQTEAVTQAEDPSQTEASVSTEVPDAGQEGTDAGSEAASETQPAGGYEDNFAVDSEAAAAFGTQVKEAVAARDLEALADLTAYPVYVGFTDGSVSAASREEFVALGAERIFTPELVESVENADVNSLSPSMAGFVLATDARPNIIFSVVDGSLAIQGINY